jgi:phage-related protein
MLWTVETYDRGVDAEIEVLPIEMRKKLARMVSAICIDGPERLPGHAFKHLEGKLWELRIIGRDGIARVVYVTMTGKRVILLRAFIKKTQKTPTAELEIARARLNALIRDPSRNS